MEWNGISYFWLMSKAKEREEAEKQKKAQENTNKKQETYKDELK